MIAAPLRAWAEAAAARAACEPAASTSMMPCTFIASASTTRPRASTTAEIPVLAALKQRYPVFHGPNLRLPKVLIGTGRVAEPGIVGDVDNKVG